MPRLTAVIRPLDDLTEPPGGLRREEPFRIRRRALHVIDLPAAEMRTADAPLLALSVRLEDERALLCADEYTHAAHVSGPPAVVLLMMPRVFLLPLVARCSHHEGVPV